MRTKKEVEIDINKVTTQMNQLENKLGKLRVELEEVSKICYINQRFVFDDEEFILAQTDCKKVSLISLSSGNRWNEGVAVVDEYNITEEEFKEISFNRKFRLIDTD
jgi:hypothetical protein